MPNINMSAKEKKVVQAKIDLHAEKGFRTMVCAYKVMSKNEYQEFKQIMNNLMHIET